jgi:hypothetical protein
MSTPARRLTRPDPASIVLGALAVGLGIAAISGRLGEVINEPATLVPALLGLLAVAVVVSLWRRPSVSPPPAEAPQVEAEAALVEQPPPDTLADHGQDR